MGQNIQLEIIILDGSISDTASRNLLTLHYRFSDYSAPETDKIANGALVRGTKSCSAEQGKYTDAEPHECSQERSKITAIKAATL